jgi:hypothetical protein
VVHAPRACSENLKNDLVTTERADFEGTKYFVLIGLTFSLRLQTIMAKRDASPKRQGKPVYIVLRETYFSDYDATEDEPIDEEEDPLTEILGVFGSKQRAVAFCESTYKEEIKSCKIHLKREAWLTKEPEWVFQSDTFSERFAKYVLMIKKESVQ